MKKEKLTQEEFIEILIEGYNAPKTTQLRSGQAMYNKLHGIAPDVAHEINATDCDPFYDNSKIAAFIEMLESKLKRVE